MPGVFISYRREDSAGHAGRLFDRLRGALGPDRVFMDITGIEAGVDFVETLETAVASCDVLLTIIGPEWLACTDATGVRRLDDPSDFTRIEIAAALQRHVRVVPVLVGGAQMPPASRLPDELKPLARRQAIELRDTRWDADADHLIGVLQRVLASGRAAQVEAAPAGAARHDAPAARGTGAAAARRTWPKVALLVLVVGGGALAMIAAPGLRRDLLSLISQRPGTQSADTARPLVARQQAEPPAAAPDPQPTASTGASSPPRRPPAPSLARVPDVRGRSLIQASQILRNEGFVVQSKAAAPGRGGTSLEVLEQTPAAGTAAAPGSRVTIVYAKPERTVPVLTGLLLDDALAELRSLGLVVGAVVGEASKRPPKEVLRQSPGAGAQLQAGTKVDLVYAEAPPDVTVPNLVGSDMRSAIASLDRAGLTVTSRQAIATRDVPPGQIVKQDPPPGRSVARGTGVTLEYAASPLVVVPDVSGRSVAEAFATLKAAGLAYRTVGQDSHTASPGTVLRQSPAGGSRTADAKPTVELTIATLPPLSLLSVHCDPLDRAIAERLSAYLRGEPSPASPSSSPRRGVARGYRAAEYRVVAQRGLNWAGFVDYSSDRYERMAQSVAARSSSWLSTQYGRSVVLTVRRVPAEKGGASIVVWLPKR
jgi:hypothetical protein